MRRLILMLCFDFVVSSVSGFADVSEVCEMMKADERDIPGPMNFQPGIHINLFPELLVPQSGRVKNITFYAVRAGEAYVSFWKSLDNNMFELGTKILVTSDGNGVQRNEPVWNYYVEQGQAIAIHYADSSTQGVIAYEENGPWYPRTPGVPVYSVYNPKWLDNGWYKGMVLNVTAWLNEHKKNVALHFTVCECANNTFGEECEPCSDYCLAATCNESTGVCEKGCKDGFQGPYCNQSKGQTTENNDNTNKKGMKSSNTGWIAALVAVTIVALVFIVSTTALAILLKRTRQSKDV